MTARTLVVMRHAKAEQYAESDHDRPLSARGRADAAAAGAHLARRSVVPDYALVSTARRTVETWRLVQEATGAEAEEELSEAMYAATPASVVESLRLVPEEVRVAMVVGHNPCVDALVHLLDDGEGDPAVLSALLSGMRPGSLAVFELAVPWPELSEHSARLVDVSVPG